MKYQERTVKRMSEEEIKALFETCGALLEGHFVYQSGRHGGFYVAKDAVIGHPVMAEMVCAQIVDRFRGCDIDIVAAPAIGGVVLAQLVARMLCTDEKEVLAVYAEKDKEDPGQMTFRHPYNVWLPGTRLLALEDVVTTCASLKKMIAAARLFGAEIVGSCILWNRSGECYDQELGVQMQALVNFTFESYLPNDCPHCARQEPFTEIAVGHAHDKK